MSKLKKIKDKLSEEDMEEALEVFNFINENYYLKSKKIKGELQNEIEYYDELKKIQDIDKIIQERDYYKKKCKDFENYGIR